MFSRLLVFLSLLSARSYADCEGADADLQLAQEEYVHGRYDDALRRVQRLLTCPLVEVRARRLHGASSCFRRDPVAAEAAYARLPNTDKYFLRYVCERNGLFLTKGDLFGPRPRVLVSEEVIGELLILHGRAAEARERARRAGPSPRSWRLIGAASCVLGDKTVYQEMLDLVDDEGRNYMQLLCRRAGDVRSRVAPPAEPGALDEAVRQVGRRWADQDAKSGAPYRITLDRAAVQVAPFVDWTSVDWQELLQTLAERAYGTALERNVEMGR